VSGMRGMLVAALIAAMLAPAATVRAGEEEDRAAKARVHYENGMAHFNLEEWDQAIAEWEAGYRVKPVPEFMFNIAQAYRKSQRYERALTFYQRYLRLAPNADNRGEVEKQIAQLQPLAEEEKRNAAKYPKLPPPTEPAPATPREQPAPSPKVEPATPKIVEPAAAAPRPELVAQAPERRPVYKKAWFWVVTIGAVAVVGAGVALGVVYGTKDNTKVLPPAMFQ